MNSTLEWTADIVLLAGPAHARQVLLVRRSTHSDAYPGAWALPGGFVDPPETALAAAFRELREETGLSDIALTEVGTWDTPGRDPRGPVATVAHVGILSTTADVAAGDDADQAEWVPVATALTEGLAFDHADILHTAHTTSMTNREFWWPFTSK